MSKPISKELEEIIEFKQQIDVEAQLIIQKALNSNDPNAIIKANNIITQLEKTKDGYKSYIFDPWQFNQQLGYKYKPENLTYRHLRNMARTPVGRSVIGTRIDQICRFGQPQTDEQAVGWMIRKKRGLFDNKKKELTKEEQYRIEDITEFILHAGVLEDKWGRVSFDQFLRMTMKDSLELDQMTYEIRRTRNGKLYSFMPTDGATYRLSDNFTQKEEKRVKINGYFPTYVQIYETQVVSEFYPWELCFEMRNRTTDILQNGYSISELEDLVKIVTWMLYGDSYNGMFFSQGSSPKGILKVSGNIDTQKLAQFRQQWQTMMSGVSNSHKTPIIESDKMEWIDLQKNNRDMEFKEWNQYLRGMFCAVYKIDPSEIGFPYTGGKGGSLFGEQGQKQRTDFSKEKGLKPLLKFRQYDITKYLVSELDPAYEFVFTGLDPEDEQQSVDLDVKRIQNWMTVNEIREKRNLPPIEGGDVVLSSVMLQYKGQQMGMGGGQPQPGMEGEEEDIYEENPFEQYEKGENPIMLALDEWIEKGMPVE